MKKLALPIATIMALCLALPATASAAKRKTAKTTKTEKREVKVEEVGMLRNEDVRVVQKNLFVKKGYHEVGFLLSTTPLDTYVAGLMLGADITLNATERIGVNFLVQGGYGWGNGHWQDVTFLGNSAGGNLTSLGADAARNLFGGGISLVWSPIYGKFAWGTRGVVHFDIYAILGGHGYLTQLVDAGGGLSGLGGPTAGIGVKFQMNQTAALKIDFRDNISIEQRTYTGRIKARSSWQIGVGIAFYPTRGKK